MFGNAIDATKAVSYKYIGRKGVLQLSITDCQNSSQLGVMIYNINDFKPLSNIVLFTERDFKPGDGNALFLSMVQDLQSGAPLAGTQQVAAAPNDQKPTYTHGELVVSQSRPFALTAPQFFKTAGPNSSYITVMRIEALNPWTFQNPGLRAAIVAFDKDLVTPPDDLALIDNTFQFTLSSEGTSINWKMKSEKMNVGGNALQASQATPYECLGRYGVIRINVPAWEQGKQVGFMIHGEDFKPLSNIILFKESDFKPGDGKSLFDSIVAELQSSHDKQVANQHQPDATPGIAEVNAQTPQDLEKAKALHELGRQAYKKGDTAGALDAWSKALAIYKTIKGTETQQAALQITIDDLNAKQ